ncbi:TPA: hypothetical protein I9089_002348 [Clostridium perfringens]|nr:hypothetical protein [Clostridium perfringens]
MNKIICPNCKKSDSFWISDSELIDNFEAVYEINKYECQCGRKFKVSITYKADSWEYEN